MATVVEFENYEVSVPEALEHAGLAEKAADAQRIIIKPNLLEDIPPPTTTDVRCVAAIVNWLRVNVPDTEIVIAEGSGGCDTPKAFRALGYDDLSEDLDVPLIDLDRQPVREIEVPGVKQWDTIFLPETILDGFLISAAVLKHHTITAVTLALKNLIGMLPEEHYSGFWSYKKSMVHKDDVEKVIHDINVIRRVDFAVIDAAVGQQGSHLRGGTPFNPPINKIIASPDPVAADEAGCRLLGVDPNHVEHIQYCRDIYC
ncbi:DUF362 domain-containing protein [Planctomycetota bacterium]